MKICLKKTTILFQILSGVAIFIGGYVFLGKVEDVFGLAGTQWVLIAIMFGILAINTSLMSGGSFFSVEDCDCKNGKCGE